MVSEVGFEPTPAFADQKSLSVEQISVVLESGALDHSAILTTAGKGRSMRCVFNSANQGARETYFRRVQSYIGARALK